MARSVLSFILLFLSVQLIYALTIRPRDGDSVDQGFQSSPNISHQWGQYSPFFSVPSEISADTPDHCRLTFAQVLSRHGARDPTASKTKTYGTLIATIKANVTSFTGVYAFLSSYSYTLGADDLTIFGQQEMINSGIKFYNRYQGLNEHWTPFSALQEKPEWWNRHKISPRAFTKQKLQINPEDAGSNNTLNHGLCTQLDTNPSYSNIASSAQKAFLPTFAPPITTRLNAALPGITLKDSDTIV